MEFKINYSELKELIDEVKVTDYSQFEYLGLTFTIITHRRTKQDVNDAPVWWSSGSTVGDFDIYLATNVVKRKFRRPVIFHEALEAVLDRELAKDLGLEISKHVAHNIATAYDEKYAKEVLDDINFGEYLKFKGVLSGFFGS